jgi:FKBP-type peptidyl-prolyl cis-trans isomerase
MTRSLATLASAALTLSLALAFASPACKAQSSAKDGGTTDAPAAPVGLPAPPDVAAPPADAVKTASGLATKVLTPGTGTDHPAINDTVKVNFSGWTTDGKMFASTVAPLQKNARPAPTNKSIAHETPGMSEALRLMVVGETRRIWIPPELLTNNNRPGSPAGMQVFEVELLEITPGPKPPEGFAAAPPDAQTLKDGLATKVLQPGTGKDHPQPNDAVRVIFSTWQRDGRLLDSSRDKPMLRPVTGFFDGWAEAVQLMVVGEKRMIWVPSALAPKGRPGGPPPADVTTMVELQEILPGPKTPADVKAPPKDATVEKDGLAWKVLTKGTGTAHPSKTASVTVQYAGWTTDGKMFDSSFSKGAPATFGVSSVIPGWTEVLQLMVEGEKRRVWIPEQLAYKGQPSAPQGMLVFEIELQKIGPDMPQRPRPHGMGPGGPGGGPGGPPGMPPGQGGPGGPGGPRMQRMGAPGQGPGQGPGQPPPQPPAQP